jgi:hypothetical protein
MNVELSPASEDSRPREQPLYVPRTSLGAGNLTVEAQLVDTGDTPEGTTCAVCQEAPVTHRTACGHYIHDRCLEPWLRHSDKCPVCRAQLPLTCHASWTHNESAVGELAQLPPYLCRSQFMFRVSGVNEDSTGDETETESDSSEDESSQAANGLRAAMEAALADVGAESVTDSEGEDNAEDEEETCWNDSHNHITIHAHGRANVTLRIGSVNR